MPHTRSYSELVEAWRDLARCGHVELLEYVIGNPKRLMLQARVRPEHPQQVMIVAGVHGDEPVTSWALLHAITAQALNPAFGYNLWCCANPSGYLLGTRENQEGVDINRSYIVPAKSVEAELIIRQCMQQHYALLLDLHEDFEAEGAYLYEPVIDGAAPLGRGILQALEDASYPLQAFSPAFDLGYPSEDAESFRALEHGRVLPNVEHECEYFLDGLPLTMYFLSTGMAARTLTIESPRSLPWLDRMAIHQLTIAKALEGLHPLVYGADNA